MFVDQTRVVWVVGSWLLELCLFESWLFELCSFESFELFGLCVLRLCADLDCASCFMCAWVLCFGFALARFAADLGAGVSESAQRAPRGQRPGVRAGSCCRRALSVCSCCVCVGLSWLGGVRVGLG